jgi:hypothetical protein
MANIFTETHDLSLVRGDDWRYEIPVIDSNNAAFDWTGYTSPKSEMRRNIDDPNIIADLAPDIETGLVRLNQAAANTLNIEPGTYYYDFEVVFPDLTKQTLIRGKITVIADVTLP